MGTYSREEAEQVPNQWWDVWDLFPNVSEREIENPYDHNWARRPEQIEANYNEDGTFKEVLRLNLAGFPIPRFTRENELYYYTRKDQNTGEIIPVTQSTSQNRPWYKGLPYPLPGSEKQNDLSDYAFASWLFNQAPAQVAPLAALGKGIPQIRTQRRTSPPGFYREGSVNVNLKNVEKDVTNILSLSRFKNTRPKGIIPKYSSGAVVQTEGETLYRPTPGTMTSTFMSRTDNLIPEWFFSQKGTQFEDTSDAEGLNKPPGLDPKKERDWYAKLTYRRVLDEVLRQGGTKLEAQRLFAEKRDFFEPLIDKRTGERKGKGIVATITELNNMMDKWMPGIQVRTTPSVKDGVEIYRYQFKDVDGRFTTWDLEKKKVDELLNYSKTTFAKDHLSPVKDRSRIGGGYYGADNPGNFEILYQFVNTQKSNRTQLPKGLLKEMGVPGSLSEWVNMRLYPQNYEGMFVPHRWKENFQKIVLAEYYEKTKGLQSANKRKGIMDKLVRTWSVFFKDPENVRALEMLEEALGQQVAKNMEEGIAAGNEVPAWIGLLQKPPGGWNSKDPWWTSLSKDAQTRYRYIYDYKQRTILQDPYKRPPQGTKDYEL